MKYFGIRELIPCVDGHCKDGRCGVPDSGIVKVPSEVIGNAIALVEEVLDPLRKAYGKPIRVNSGYRCPAKNKAVGGATASQHMKGEAADITAGSPEENIILAQLLVKAGKYYQCIIYVGRNDLKPRFIHVSWKRCGGNRTQLRKKVDGVNGYPMLDRKEVLGHDC